MVPAGFPEWEATMNSWGTKLLSAVETVSEMLAIGEQLDALLRGRWPLAPRTCS